VREEKVEQESVANVIDAKGCLYLIISLTDTTRELQPSIRSRAWMGGKFLASQSLTKERIFVKLERLSGRNITLF
jgi:hypothetical protein